MNFPFENLFFRLPLKRENDYPNRLMRMDLHLLSLRRERDQKVEEFIDVQIKLHELEKKRKKNLESPISMGTYFLINFCFPLIHS